MKTIYHNGVSPSYEAYKNFQKQLDEISKIYGEFWKEFFSKYGFIIIDLKSIHIFNMEYNGRIFQIFCNPSQFNGIKLTEQFKYATFGIINPKRKMIKSESGAIKWMRKSGLGKPLV